MSTPQQETSQIGPLVLQNFSLFQNAIARLGDDPESGALVKGELGRLKLWSGSLGAHRTSGFRSLDYRLRDASHIQKHVVSILSHLAESLKEVIELTASDGTAYGVKFDDNADEDIKFQCEYLWGGSKSQQAELDQVLRDVVDGVDCLLRFSVAIRNPASHDRNKAETLETSLSFYEGIDIRHTQEKFPKASEALAKRLGRALTRRRQYFQYREKHHQHLSEGLDQGPGARHIQEMDKTTIASSLPDHLKAENVPSDFKGIPEIDDTRSEVSCTSYASSTVDVGKLRVPPLPIEHEYGPFLCPFCHTIVSVKARPEWKKHVFRDLRPYICLSDSCPAPDHQFARRHEWTQHNLETHWLSWLCALGCPDPFDSRGSFLQHTQSVHSNEIDPNNLETLERLCRKKDLERLDQVCPLCEEVDIGSVKQYESHVGRHLEDLALFALPKTDDPGDDDSDDLQSEGSKERSSAFAINKAINPILAKSKFLQGLENLSPDAEFEQSFSMSCVNESGDNGQYHVRHGKSWTLNFKNLGNEPLYVHVFNLCASGRVQDIIRDLGKNPNGFEIAPGTEFPIILRMEIPEQHLRHTEDVLKFTVTSKPTQFPLLRLPEIGERGTSRGSESDGFNEFHNFDFLGLGAMRNDGDVKWSTKNFTIVISR